jgi:hypothetical protein
LNPEYRVVVPARHGYIGWWAGTTTQYAGVNYISQSGTMNLAIASSSYTVESEGRQMKRCLNKFRILRSLSQMAERLQFFIRYQCARLGKVQYWHGLI